MEDRLGWRGMVQVRVQPLDRYAMPWDVQEFPNLITNAGLDALVATLNGGEPPEITWVAIGSGTTAPAPGQTTLTAETFRKQVTKQTASGVGGMRTDLYLAPAEGIGQINEIGWFAGAGASSTPNSGIMIARVLYAHMKTALESITIVRTDTLARI